MGQERELGTVDSEQWTVVSEKWAEVLAAA